MPGEKTCQSCGAAVSKADRFCPSCGGELASAARRGEATVPSQGSLERITTERLTSATAGEFEILERLGYGAMGSVYLARDVALSRRVAIKVISPHLLEDESVISRFRLEAQTVAALRHPNIVNLYGVRQFGDLHYFIMDFIDGPSLRALMKAHAPLEIPVAQALLYQICSALNYAHHRGRGVIHRDVKPANIMVDREGQAVVMDFGISRVGEDRSGLTQTGATIGTPEYMSPEQCMDQELTGASDQYALGIVAYEMITGRLPFTGSTYSIMMAHASSPPPPIQAVRPDCPPQVEAAILRMLAKSPAERFSDADAAATALGGKPLGSTDAVRHRIIELVEPVASAPVALDDSSPLSPVPGATERATLTILGLPDIVEPGDRFDLRVESRRGTGPARPMEHVVWSVSEAGVASVQDGTVVAHVPGSASLTATVGGVASTVVVSVRERRSANVTLRPQTVLMEAGGTTPLHADVLDRNGDPLATPVVWSTANPSVALVAQDGTVTAVAAGSTTITADADGVTANSEIEVRRAAVHELSIAGAPPVVHVGDELVFDVLVADSRGTALDRSVTWRSDQPKVVAVREGRPVAVATGTATLQAECEGRTTTVSVKVEPAEVASVVIAGLPDAPTVGGRYPLQAVLLHHTGKPLIRGVTWATSDPSIATVTDAGVLDVRGTGTVEVTARSENVTESATLECAPAEPATAQQTASLRGHRASAPEGPPASGTKKAPGRARRRLAPWLGLAAILVVAFGIAQTVGRGGDAANEGSAVTEQGAAPGASSPEGTDPAEGSTAPPGGEAGVPADQTVAGAGPGDEGPVESTGADPVPAQYQGPPPERAAAEPVAPTVDLTAVASVRIDGGDRVLTAGAQETLTAAALNANGEPVAASVIRWRTSDPGVATVRDGEVRATAPGRATISAQASGIEGSVQVTVERTALEAPTREEALAQLQRFVTLLRTGDTDAVSRLLGRAGARVPGRAGARGDTEEVLARMREANFTARISRMGDPQLTPNGAAVDFDTELMWRNAQGAREQRTVPFFALMQPAPNGWRLAGIRRRPS